MPERIAHAKAYPFHIPGHSFVYRDGEAHPATESEIDFAALARDGRAPVIACGSNRAPEQLRRKYGHLDGVVTIPVQRAWLADFDVVYAAHITRYGSIAATLQHVAGTSVEVSITWLSDSQLELMHATEGRGERYDYVRLGGLDLSLESAADGDAWGDGRLDFAFAYIYRDGCLAHEGAPVGLAEIAARERPHRALGQPEAQALVHSRLAGSGDLDTFILENVTDAAARRAREERLAGDALAFAWPDITTIVP